eukprot:gene23343-35755_t
MTLADVSLIRCISPSRGHCVVTTPTAENRWQSIIPRPPGTPPGASEVEGVARALGLPRPVDKSKKHNKSTGNSGLVEHKGYLAGPNLQGSPMELTLAQAEQIALSNPNIKGFCYQAETSDSLGPRAGLVWVYFKPTFEFFPSEMWRSVQVIPVPSYEEEARSPVDKMSFEKARDRIVRFYQCYCPQKLPTAILTLKEYKGMEDSLNGGKQWKKPQQDDPPPNPKDDVDDGEGNLLANTSATGGPAAFSRMLTMPPSPFNPVRPGAGTAGMAGIAASLRKPVDTSPSNRAALVGLAATGVYKKLATFLGENGYASQLHVNDSLPGSRPTKANILKALDWLVDGAEPGACLFFYYSGTLKYDQLEALDNEYVGQQEIVEVLNRSGLDGSVRITFLFDASSAGRVLQLPYQLDNEAPGVSVLTANSESVQVLPDVVAFSVADGFPPLGALTLGVTLVVRKEPQSYEDVLEEIRGRAMRGATCTISIAASHAGTSGYYSLLRADEIKAARDNHARNPPSSAARNAPKSDAGPPGSYDQSVFSASHGLPRGYASDAQPVSPSVLMSQSHPILSIHPSNGPPASPAALMSQHPAPYGPPVSPSVQMSLHPALSVQPPSGQQTGSPSVHATSVGQMRDSVELPHVRGRVEPSKRISPGRWYNEPSQPMQAFENFNQVAPGQEPPTPLAALSQRAANHSFGVGQPRYEEDPFSLTEVAIRVPAPTVPPGEQLDGSDTDLVRRSTLAPAGPQPTRGPSTNLLAASLMPGRTPPSSRVPSANFEATEADMARKQSHLSKLEGVVSQLEAGEAPPDDVLREVLNLLG